MKNERILEPPLPQHFKRLYQVIRIQSSISIVRSIFILSCLIQQVSNIKISHEAFWIALVAIIVSVIISDFQRNSDKNTVALVILMIGLFGLLMGARISYFLLLIYLSIYVLILVCIIMLGTGQFFLFMMNLIVDSVLLHLFWYLALDMGSINFKLSYWSIFPIIVIGLGLALFILNGIAVSSEQGKKDKQKKYRMVKQEIHRTIYKIFFISHLVLCFSCYFVKIFISKQFFIFLLTSLFFFDSLLSILLFAFRQELVLYFNHPEETQNKLLRTHQRGFKQMNNPTQLRLDSREIDWNVQQCLQCQKEAEIVHFPCGHLVLCQKCYQSKQNVKFENCQICAKEVRYIQILNLDEKKNRYIYRRKVNIEKFPNKNFFQTW